VFVERAVGCRHVSVADNPLDGEQAIVEASRSQQHGHHTVSDQHDADHRQYVMQCISYQHQPTGLLPIS